jgi:hypothetical protein
MREMINVKGRRSPTGTLLSRRKEEMEKQP